ncbi:MAG: type I-C CRISPR-associated protein Cas8c/Csd1 [Lachnospiraceae bacterium]
MILRALTDYYEELLKEGKTVSKGWCRAKVAYALNLSEDGTLKNVFFLKTQQTAGKKQVWVPQMRTVPQMTARSSGVSANFLCDNSKYLLGVDENGSGKRLQECFEAARTKHEAILADVHSTAAEAIRHFFETWNPKTAKEHPKLQEIWEEITDGSNLIFYVNGREAGEDDPVRKAWEQSLNCRKSGQEGICLVTGEQSKIARIHTAIKGVQGAQSSGAALVSFNAPAFESYGKEQSYNASVGEYAAFAYTTALNYLLSQKEWVKQLGDTTVVFWAENGKEVYQDIFNCMMEAPIDNQRELRGIFEKLSKGAKIEKDGLILDETTKFYILGLAPNAARLAVRFFYQDSFGNILDHVKAHYERMEMIKPSWETREYVGLWSLLQETVNQNAREKKPVPNMASAVLRAILSGARYPANLYSNVMIRIRSEQGKMTWGRASIIKAYLMKNCNWKKGEDYVKVNENSAESGYILGRIFAVLEEIQEKANPSINTTIRDRYFNSACTTPAAVFPIIIRLKNSHIRKFDKVGMRIYYENMLTELMGKLDVFPRRLTLEEQGQFMLGYYHQVQKRYTKKEEE